MRTKHVLRWVFLSIFLPVLMVAFFLQEASAKNADRPMAQAATSTNGYWKFDSATTFQNFTPGTPNETWTPLFGDLSNGFTINSDNFNTTTQCLWSVSGDSKALHPGGQFEVALTVNSTVNTGKNISLSGQDSMQVIGFDGSSIEARDEYSLNANSSTKASGSGKGSFEVPVGSTGGAKQASKLIHFTCSTGGTFVTTTWKYVWIEGPASPSETATPESGAPATGSIADLTSFLTAAGVASAVIGVLLAALGLIAILIDITRKGGKPPAKPTGPKKTEPEPPQIIYTLRSSAASVDVYRGEPAAVTFTAMRSAPGGVPVLAADATVRVITGESAGGLAASPTSAAGSLTCTFSAPNPTVCTNLDVLAVALVGEQVKARAYVRVCIKPVYELELQWENPQQPALQVDGKEALAWARVVSIPPDPNTPADMLAQQISVSLQGANRDWIRQPLSPYIQYEKQWNSLSAVNPGTSAEPAAGNPELVAEFNSARQQLKARLTVELVQEIALSAWVNGKKDTDVIYQRNQETPGWEFAEIHTHLHAMDNEEKSIKPGFNIGDGPYIEAKPPILDVKDHFELAGENGKYVIQVKLKEGTDLETCFGEVPVDQRNVKVKVFITDDAGHEYYDTVTYRIRPSVTFCVHAFDLDPANRVAQHTYRKNVFSEEMSVVANGDDRLAMAGYFMLSDEFAKSGPDPKKRLEVGEVSGFAWRNSQDETDFGEPQVDEANTKDGFFCFVLKSKEPLEATPERLDTAHTLVFKLGMPSDAASGYSLDFEELELGIAVQALRLHFWVVPGLHRHTSEAVAYLDLLPAHKPLEEQTLYLSTKALAGMDLEPDGSPANQETNSSASSLGAGTVKWCLRYSHITWNNMPEAEFTVRCGLEDPPDERWQAETHINVYENLLALLNDLTEDTNLAPEINNPNRRDLVPVLELPAHPSDRPWDTPENVEKNLRELEKSLNWTREWSYIVTAMPQIIRDNIYGPIYNLLSWWPPREDKYVCSELRRKIATWLEKRRFKGSHEPAGEAVARLEKMNGLDFGYYAIVPAHVWAGIFPAGADRFVEYRALDPWWGQEWPDEWRRPENLLTQNDEDARGILFRAFNIYLAYKLVESIPAITIQAAIEAIRAWLRGEPPERIRQIIGESGFSAWYERLQVDSDIVDAEGRYLGGITLDVENWLPALIKDLN